MTVSDNASARPPRRTIIAMVCDEIIHNLWRLETLSDGTWSMIYIGYTPTDPPLQRKFSSHEDLPQWTKERVAVLRLLDIDPHTSIVFGVGRRIGEDTYWVVEPKQGEKNGGNT